MPPLVAAAAIGAGGAIGGGLISSHSAGSAAKQQTDAANHAADVQGKAAADALAFQKAQAAQDLITANATQKANYDQWAARQGRLSNLSVLTGAGKFDIPAYAPIPTAPQTPAAPTSYAAPVAAQPAPIGYSQAGATNTPSNTTSMASLAAPNGASGNMVMMKSPTGQVKLVPQVDVVHYKEQGAEVVGG